MIFGFGFLIFQVLGCFRILFWFFVGGGVVVECGILQVLMESSGLWGEYLASSSFY